MTLRIGLFVLGAILASQAAADPLPDKVVVATWNLEWFFDDYVADNFRDLPRMQAAPSRADWDWKLGEVARVMGDIRPTILALQEVENRRVLFYLTQRLKQDYGLNYSVAFVEGEDYFTEQDVAVLALEGLTDVTFKRQTKSMYSSGSFYNVNKHVLCRFEWGAQDAGLNLVLLNVHLRAQDNAAEIRKRQARLIRHWICGLVKEGQNVVVLGDMNTSEAFEATTATSELGILRGLDTPEANDDLLDLFAYHRGPLPETHLVHKQFDRILAAPAMVSPQKIGPRLSLKSVSVRKDLVVRGSGQDEEHRDTYWKIAEPERDVSDHYPVVAEFDVHTR